MKLKRLKHHADGLAQKTCGWEILGDAPRLAELGEGVILIDALSGACTYGGDSVEPLSIALVLRDWLHRDAGDYGIAPEHYRLALVKLSFKAEVTSGERVELHLRANSEVQAAGKRYSSQFENRQWRAL